MSLVCWRESAPGDVRCARVDAGGRVLDLNGGLLVAMTPVAALDVAVVDGRFFVAWNFVPPQGGTGSLSIRSVDPMTGALGPPTPVATDVYWPTRPAFGGGSSGQLVWMRGSGQQPVELVSASVSAMGQVGTTARLAGAVGSPSIARSGAEWLVTWVESTGLSIRRSLMGARRSAGGFAPIDAPFLVSEGIVFRELPVAGIPGGWIAAHASFVQHPQINNVRVQARFIGVMPSPRDAGVSTDSGSSSDAGSASDAVAAADAVAPAPDGGIIDAGGGADAAGPSDAAANGLAFVTTPEEDARCDREYVYEARAVSAGGAAVTYALAEKPGDMTIDRTHGEITWTPSASAAGEHAVELLASDGRTTVRQLYTLTVSCPVTALREDGCECSGSAGTGGGAGLSLLVLVALFGLMRARMKT